MENSKDVTEALPQSLDSVINALGPKLNLGSLESPIEEDLQYYLRKVF